MFQLKAFIVIAGGRDQVPGAEGAIMTDHPSSQDLSEVLRLATLLADQVLDAQVMSRPISDQQVRALLDATLLLEDYDLALPPLLGQIMHEATAAGLVESDASQHVQPERPTGRLSKVMRVIRGVRG